MNDGRIPKDMLYSEFIAGMLYFGRSRIVVVGFCAKRKKLIMDLNKSPSLKVGEKCIIDTLETQAREIKLPTL